MPIPPASAASIVNRDSLIQVDELNQLLQQHDEKLLILGMTPQWRFVQRHIPHSVQIWRPAINKPRSWLLSDGKQFQALARGMGIDHDSRVVIWDEHYDATRLWWAFAHFGKADVQVLDGGLQAWRQAGLPLHRGPARNASRRGQGNFTSAAGTVFPIASAAFVLESKNKPIAQLWDCRDPDEWHGQRRLKGARKPGRIPWAQHLPWQLFRQDRSEGSRFRRPEEMTGVIETRGLDATRQQIFYCQAGVRTTTAIFTLYRLGWPAEKLFNYDGSWREWSADPNLPSTSSTDHPSFRRDRVSILWPKG